MDARGSRGNRTLTRVEADHEPVPKAVIDHRPGLASFPAVNHAAALAKASGASLHIAGLIGPLDLLSFLEQGDRETAREAYLQDHRDWLKAQTDNLRTRGQ